MKIRYLHLSDLYADPLEGGFYGNAVNESMLACIEGTVSEKPPHFVIITGDLSRSGKPEEFEYAEKFCNELLRIVKLPRERIYIVPGNHDVDRAEVRNLHIKSWYLFDSQEHITEILEDSDILPIIMRKFGNFNAFSERVTGRRRFDKTNYFFTEPLIIESENEKVQIDLAGLNSCIFAPSAGYDEKVVLGYTQINRLKTMMTNDSLVSIAFFHHPFGWHHIVDNACEQFLMDRFDLILTGHCHQETEFFLHPPGKAALIGSGTCYSPVDERRKYFNIVDIDTETRHARVQFYKYLTTHNVWKKDTDINPDEEDGHIQFSLDRIRDPGMMIYLDPIWKVSIDRDISKALYISRATFHNIQGFENTTFDFMENGEKPSAFTLILGDNSTGKSSFLRCLALGMCDETGATALLNDFQGNLVRLGEHRGRIHIELTDSEGDRYSIVTEIEKTETFEQINQKYSWVKKGGIGEDNIIPKEFPWGNFFLCGYGPIRVPIGRNVRYEAYRARDAVRTLFQYDHPMQDPEVSLNRLIRSSRIRPGEDKDRIERETLAAFLNLIRELFMFGEHERIELTKNGIELVSERGRTSLSSEGDGYKSTMGWVMDFVTWRMLADNTIDPGNLFGIVLLDEIEQHLHPRWQRYIIRKLREQFPHTQFIATTHSPLCVSGMADLDEKEGRAFRLLREEKGVAKFIPISAIRGMKSDQILTSDAFDLPSTRNTVIAEKLERFGDLYLKSRLTPEEEREFAALRDILDRTLPESAETAEQRVMQHELQEMMEDFKKLSAE